MDHHLGGVALGTTVSHRYHGTGDQTMAVIDQGMAHVAQLAGALAFAIKPRAGSVFDWWVSLLRFSPLKLPPSPLL
jgi:hypothetical protein